MLSEYESNGSSLLMKHRDHYSHSVFVFALGLAIYETNAHFRRAFNLIIISIRRKTGSRRLPKRRISFWNTGE